MSIKFLSAKFGFTPPPPKRAQNEEKLYKLVEILQNPFSGGGGSGGTQFYGQNDFMDIWAFLIFAEIYPEIRPKSFGAFLAGRKILPPNFTRDFTSEISNFKSNFTKKCHSALLQAWQPYNVQFFR